MNTLKKIASVSLVFLVCALPIDILAEKSKIRIGVPIPLTGDAQIYGEDVRDVITFAAEKMAPGEYEFFFEDDKCSTKDALTATQRLIDRDKVDFIIGYVCSGSVLASAPVINKAKIPAIIIGSSSPKVAQAGEYIFRTAPNDGWATKVLHDYISGTADAGGKLAIISTESDYAQDLMKSFLEHEESEKIFNEVVTEDYLPGSPDFKTIFTKLKSAGVDSLFLNPQLDADMRLMFRQLDELKWHPKLYAAYFPSNPELLKDSGKMMEGIIYVDVTGNLELLNDEGRSLYNEYLQKYKMRGLEFFFPSTIEAFRMMNQAIRQSNRESAPDGKNNFQGALKYFLSTTFEGVFGPYSFDKNGELIGQKFSIKKISGGKAETLL